MKDVRREDIDGDEAWHRTTNEPDIRLVEAIRNDDPPGWQVGVAVMELPDRARSGTDPRRSA